jgi:hypothetical protein
MEENILDLTDIDGGDELDQDDLDEILKRANNMVSNQDMYLNRIGEIDKQ